MVLLGHVWIFVFYCRGVFPIITHQDAQSFRDMLEATCICTGPWNCCSRKNTDIARIGAPVPMQAAGVYEQILSATNNPAPVAVEKLRAVECAQNSVRSMTHRRGALYYFCSDSKISSSLYLLSSLLQFSSVALDGSCVS